MSIDLSRALHSAVDAAHDDDRPLDLELATLARRIRRRRHVRAGVRAGVGVAAVGAVALTAPQLAGGSSPARPAALPLPVTNAGPGACGSQISQLDLPAAPQAGLVAASADKPGAVTVPRAGGSLGAYVGDQLDLTAIAKLSLATTAQKMTAVRAAAQSRLSVAQQELATVESQRASLPSAADAHGPAAAQAEADAVEARVQAAEAEVASAQATLAAVGQAGPILGVGLGIANDVQVLVTREGTVVATDRLSMVRDTTADWIDSATSVGGASVEQSLRTCNEPGRAGGELLPAGTYQVYLGYGRNDAGTLTKAAGPWSITVERPAATTNLPAGFPSDLPLVPGPVASARRDGDGWVVDIASDATDRLDAAAQLLRPLLHETTDDVPRSDAVLTRLDDGSGLGAQVDLADGSRWAVTVSDYLSGTDNRTAVRYRVAPVGAR
jgi:hypothetical protein